MPWEVEDVAVSESGQFVEIKIGNGSTDHTEVRDPKDASIAEIAKLLDRFNAAAEAAERTANGLGDYFLVNGKKKEPGRHRDRRRWFRV